MAERGFGRVFRPTRKCLRCAGDGCSRCKRGRRTIAVWHVQYSFRGRQYRETSGSKRKADAVALLKKRHAEMGAQRKKFIGPTGDRTTVAELLQLVVEDYQIHGKRSLRRVRTAIDRLREHFPGWRAVDVTPDALKRYLQKRLEMGRALCTARNELNILKRGFRLGYELGKVDHVPTFPRIKLSNTRTGFVEADELERIVSHLPAALQPLTRFGYLTGWRWGEIATLRWSQVDFEAGIARLEPGTTKNDDGRTLPFRAVPELEALLLRQREHTTQVEVEKKRVVPHVFHRNGYRIKDIDRAWRIACKASGCPDRVFHDLRRSAVRNLERAGVPRSIAMKITGHKTEAVYRRYAIVNEADIAEGLGKLGRFLDGRRSAKR